MKPSYEELESKLNDALNKIKASQEQEPVAELESWPDDFRPKAWIGNLDFPEGTKLYAAPVIPPDVAELQQELSNVEIELNSMNINFQGMMEDRNKYKRENAELTRKLAEQQAAHRMLYEIYFDGKMPAGFTPEEELTKLLAEAKSKAVPEGWQLVPKHSRIVKIELWDGKFWQPEGSSNYNRMLEAMLAAAPQPETDRGSNE